MTKLLKQKAWSTLAIKSIDAERRIITGIASTPSTDRMGDIVEPMGAEFELPLPFLWQHDSTQPIGHVTRATPNKSGIPVEIQIAKIDEPGTLKDRLDEAWQSIDAKLVRGLSIGFAPIEYAFIDDTGGMRFTKWSWLELSAVTIPANAEASIATVKRYDAVTSARSQAPESAENYARTRLDTLKARLADDRSDRIARKSKRWEDFDASRGVKSDHPASVALLNQRLAGAVVDAQSDMIQTIAAQKFEMADIIAGAIWKSIHPLLSRIDALEAKVDARKYCGVWDDRLGYKQHNMITWGGSIWIALKDTTAGLRPSADSGGEWQLCVKKGRDGRDAPRA